MKPIAPLIAFTALALMTSAPAAVVIQLVQNGQDTQVTGTGSLYLASTVSFNSTSINGQTFLNLQANSGNSNSFTGVIPTDPDRYNIENVVRTGRIPSSLPASEYLPILNDGGAHVTVLNTSSLLFVPKNYTSGSAIDFTALAVNYQFTDFGYVDGDVVQVEWSNGGISDQISLQFSVVPEPSTSVQLMGFVVLAAALRRRSRR
jgi:opacity protein-like surface antigen